MLFLIIFLDDNEIFETSKIKVVLDSFAVPKGSIGGLVSSCNANYIYRNEVFCQSFIYLES